MILAVGYRVRSSRGVQFRQWAKHRFFLLSVARLYTLLLTLMRYIWRHGYKVNPERAVQFRKWATQVTQEFTIKGYAMDDERLKNDGT